MDILLYSKAAQLLQKDISGLHISLFDSAIVGAHEQIMAEMQCGLSYKPSHVHKKLEQLQAITWKTTETYNKFVQIRARTASAITFSSKPARSFAQMRCTLRLAPAFAKDNQTFWPLFYVLSQLILNNVSHRLTDTYFYFGYDSTFEYARRTVQETHHFRIHRQQTHTLSDELAMCKDTLLNMVKEHAFDNVVSYLKNLDYQQSLATPNELDIYETTGVFIGRQGWQELATKEKVWQIIQNSQLELRLGRSLELAQLHTFL